ncbi:MAG: hypothetical protein FWF76_04780 [Oscillospiraceae bacterium]|nr:hypothetical protein [Oscillospiraceae bacterium]
MKNKITVSEILSPDSCAKCRGCCIFEESEEWEIPAEVRPPLPPTATSDGCNVCRHLGENGCQLGENKPLACHMYPFRLMRLGSESDGKLAIAVSTFCKPVAKLSLLTLCEFVRTKSEDFKDLAKTHPEIIVEYDNNYVILEVIGAF